MCGLVAVLNLDQAPVDAVRLARLRDTMRHRGPDDAGLWVDGNVGLAHRRLSILDLSEHGHQPMVSDDGRTAIVLNGEIYNFVELRNELRRRGHTFRSTSDTEVLLHLWREQGPACLDGLVGMFGFVVWDAEREALYAVRDRAGIKPLYYTIAGRSLVLASEIKAVLAHPAVRRTLDPRGLADLFFTGYALEDRTLIDGIRELAPGHVLRFRDGALDVRPYWSIEYRYDRNRSFEDTVHEFTEMFGDAVRLHCRSDAPIGAHLSGGLDSSAVSAMAALYRSGLPTFSIRFDAGGVYDESHYAREVAAAIGSAHHEYVPETNANWPLPFLTYHVEKPVSSTGIAYFNSARLARSHVTVALTGHGGDEVLGGYPAQHDIGLGRVFESSAGDIRPARSAWNTLAFILRTEGGGGLLRRVGARFRPGAAHREEGPADAWVRTHCSLPEAGRHPGMSRSFRRALQGYSPREPFLRNFDGARTDELFDRCLHHDLRSYLPGLLHVEDRMSMALSLETRVPLLDHRLIEFAATIPPEIKAWGGRSKSILRAAMTGVLPARVVDRRDKGAFPVPPSAWLRGADRTAADALLLSDRTLDRGIYRPEWIRACVRDGRDLMALASLELWCRIFLDDDRNTMTQVEAFREELDERVRVARETEGDLVASAAPA